MKVLIVCSLGMSSEVAVNSLKKAAEEKGTEMEVHAVGSSDFEDEIKRESYDVAVIAPQIRHRFKDLKEIAKNNNVPCEVIEPRGYSPIGGKYLYEQVINILKG